MRDQESWGFEEGGEIVSGRHALRLLGGGDRYEAYLAWDDAMMAMVVVKILRPDRVDQERALRALAAEATALQALQHPVLLRLFGAQLDGPRPHLVLEFLEGPRLSTLIRRYGPLALEQAVPLATQVCSALHFMSTRGYVHLDVKPRNIIMGASPRLIDLSLARTLDRAVALTRPVGTDAYMAPEQCLPGPWGRPGSPSDVWGLAVTLQEALTGRRPFPPADERMRFPQLHHAPEPMSRRLVPPALSDVITASLTPDPAARPSLTELAERLEPFVDAVRRRPRIGRLRPRRR